MRKLFKALGLLTFAILVWLLGIPAPIDPVVWTPSPDPGFTGVYSWNDKLKASTIIPVRAGHGPEDVALDAAGNIYGGLQDGLIIRILRDGTQEVFTDTGGRPLGLHFDASGNLIVADAWKGLLSIDRDGDITVLSTQSDGMPFAFTDDLDIAGDGVIYFSDASHKFDQTEYALDLMEGRPNGRLLSYNPATGKTRTLLKSLHFANGVAVADDDSYVLVNETWRYRIRRYWLKGEKAGTSDIFIDRLPGFPDGISSNGRGTFWVAMPAPRNPDIDALSASPFRRRILSKLPAWLQPVPARQGTVIALDSSGTVRTVLHDRNGGKVYMVTSVEQVGDMLYLGSLEAPQVVRLKSPY